MQETAAAYAPLALFLVIAFLFGAMTMSIGFFIRPRNPLPGKSMPYECGNDPAGETGRPGMPRYYFFAMLLVLFDVEVIFLVPWALNAASLGLPGLLAATFFIVVLMAAYLYLWRKGDLEWD
jgi:NADH-quinone oxidoreductase subunit A